MNLGESPEGDANETEDAEGSQLLNVSMLQSRGLSMTRGYLDNCSTITAFANKDLLDNIQTTKKE